MKIEFNNELSEYKLKKCYVNERKSMTEISRIYGCHIDTVRNKLKKYEIPIRPHGAFLVDNDGKTSYSKYIKGEISYVEYQNELAKNKGYDNVNEYNKEMLYKRSDHLPMSENKKCASYLGIYICENKEFLRKIINIVESMPNGNPGYDVTCIKSKKIDVKCACLTDKNNKWIFGIKKNKIADYFLMISFDNRENLDVQHIWLVKGDDVIEKAFGYSSKGFVFNEKNAVSMRKGNKALERWNKYEITDTYKLEEAQKLCDNFKNDIK